MRKDADNPVIEKEKAPFFKKDGRIQHLNIYLVTSDRSPAHILFKANRKQAYLFPELKSGERCIYRGDFESAWKYTTGAWMKLNDYDLHQHPTLLQEAKQTYQQLLEAKLHELDKHRRTE